MRGANALDNYLEHEYEPAFAILIEGGFSEREASDLLSQAIEIEAEDLPGYAADAIQVKWMIDYRKGECD